MNTTQTSTTESRVPTAEQEENGRSELERIIRTILVPTDLSEIANHAFRFAVDLAQRAHARVILGTVIDQAAGDVYSPIRYSPEAAAQHGTALSMVRARLEALVDSERRDGVRMDVALQKGRPIPTILRWAKEYRVDLIVMGTHGRTGLNHLLLGSSAEELVRQAPCSVLTMHRSEPRKPADIRRILVPVDFSEDSVGLIDYALGLARDYCAQLDVLHVVEPMPLPDALSGIITLQDMVPDLRKRATAQLSKLLRKVDDTGVQVRLHTEEGHAASAILDFAAAYRSDLIVIGTRGISAVERFFIGSVAERIVRHAPCPVLAARLAVERS